MKQMLQATLVRIFIGSMIVFYTNSAQTSTFDRKYDPVVITCDSLVTYINQPVNEIFVFAYKNGAWRQIPFQIDEKDGGSFFGVKDGFLDRKAEISFMAADMGDSVAFYNWIDDVSSATYERYQICAIDTGVSTTTKRYAYLYRSHTMSKTTDSYMTYIPPTASAGDDTIKSACYIFGNNSSAIPDYLRIRLNDSEWGPEILDRYKIRFSGQVIFLPIGYAMTEDDFSFASLMSRAGPVRVIRVATHQVTISTITLSIPLTTVFYPYHVDLRLYQETLPSTLGMRLMRQSIDFNARVAGSTFHSNRNSGLVIDGDGSGDAVNDTLTVPGVNWMMMKGDSGTVVSIIRMPMVGEEQKLYFKDDSTNNLNDTGDLKSYGDGGVQVRSNSMQIYGIFDLTSRICFLGTGHTDDVGDTLAAQFQDTLMIDIMRGAGEVPVELAAFNAVVKDGRVLLSWRTDSETNNYGFEIERRSGKNENWIKMGFIRGAGTVSVHQAYGFIDTELDSGTYYYRLKQVDTDGQYTYSETIMVDVRLPGRLQLGQNYPNPFNPLTEITFHIPEKSTGTVELSIYNLLGQKIRTLVDRNLSSGVHKVRWDGTDDKGQQAVSGAYLYRLKIGSQSLVRKMVKMQ